MGCLIHPTYFPNVAHMVTMLSAKSICFEVCDNYQKQSFRNRTEICTANGKLALTIPVTYSQKQRQHYKDVKIANDAIWQQQHLKSLHTAYSMSPFFEFYIDDLLPLYGKNYEYILDFNFACIYLVFKLLDIELTFTKTTTFEKSPTQHIDYRPLVNRNFKAPNFSAYTQVFTQKQGFINNLSVLDVLFNEGPNAVLYFKKQTENKSARF